MEIWKDIKGYEWLYQVSNLGRIKTFNWKNSWKEKISFWHKWDRWYNTYALVDNNSKIYKTWIHRLVYCTFNNIDFKLYNPYEKTIICHKNDIKTDNRLENLFLWTAKDNHNDMVIKWRRANFKWDNNAFSKLKTEDVYNIKRLLIQWNKTHSEIWKIYNIHRTTVSWIAQGKSWKHIIL